ncbi:MAG: SPOR domain-containing protein [Gammaproteobacteria bacterium]
MKWLLGILVCLPGLAAANAEMARALDAFNRADYRLAQQTWEYLANQGNSVAQFNLAHMYRNGIGVGADDNRASRMVRSAVHGHLADAYAFLSPDALQPASREDSLQALAVTDPQIWVKTQEGKNFTLQLASSRSEQLIEKYFIENALEGKAGYYKSQRQGESWYALVYGSYESVSEANEAIANLPQDLRKWSPWVRRIDSIQKIIVP